MATPLVEALAAFELTSDRRCARVEAMARGERSPCELAAERSFWRRRVVQARQMAEAREAEEKKGREIREETADVQLAAVVEEAKDNVVVAVDPLAEIPGPRLVVVRALRRLEENVSKQLAKALRRMPKRHRKQSLPSEHSMVSGAFRAPTPSVAFDDGDLDPWAFNHDLQRPDSARHNTTEAYRNMAAEATHAEESMRSPSTPSRAVRLTQFRLDLGPYAPRTPPQHHNTAYAEQHCCTGCHYAEHEMCISPENSIMVDSFSPMDLD